MYNQMYTQRIKRQGIPALLMFGLFLMSVTVWAAPDEDANMPLDARAKADQLWTFGIIGVLVVLGVGFYYFRRWQTLHAGNVVHGSDRDD